MEGSDGSSITLISRQEGFDYDFVPPLDSKYECAICLLGLRSPMQTTCGHRFCKDCIFNCLSESSSRCPVDNTPLLESDLFADSCAEREILQLKVKCPNHALGCSTVVDLMYIEHHTQACSCQPVMCPNECSATVLQKELEQHLTSQCILRVTRCALCDQPFTFNQEQLHLLSCSRVTVTCEMCGAMMPRGEVPSHTTESCPRVVVACTFAEHGCHHKMTRSDLDQHMEQAIQYHLQLLSSANKKMNAFVSDLSRTVGLIQSPYGNFSRQPSLRSQMSATSPIPENHSSPSQHDRNLEKSFGAYGGTISLNDRSSLTPQSDELGNEINKLELQLNNLSASETKSGSKIPNTITHQEIILRDVSEKTVDLNQRMLEETIKLSNLSKRIEEVDAMVEVQLADVSGKFCNGEYVWKIKHFSHLCVELQNKPGRVLHSPPFYTSQFGYKFCLRTNITWKSNEYFFTLFIHSMQGENDDFLEWPFSGEITLSILDCGPTAPKKHITESMVSKPDLQAFQRPMVSRNPKGFGYTEFVPLAKLLKSEGGSYINSDVLCIRAIVSPKAPKSSS
ncbi:TNF receptor-associated factor 6-like [Macrobrachium rosenbergii]|uniref:Tumor necrosis factor receptor-associated factor 6 n=1 Tax=Macrobrachium rosenbergii TaxID=79674 RepID=A0A7S5AYH5_MACRS|nr:tumor necrosis factor receptor-associated factor 6 [Macrobrachium rosenbergii]